MLSQPEPLDASEGRRSRRRRELHQSILDTAAELFARDGYETTTVEKIATAADVAPATFFNHFRSKEDVLREIGQEVFSHFRRLVDEQLARPATSRERLHGFATRGAALVQRAPEMTRRVLMAVLRSPRPGEAGAELVTMQADFAQLLRRGRDDDAPAKDVPDDLDVELAAEILVSVVIGAMTHWINDPDYPLERKLRASLTLLADRLLIPTTAATMASRHTAASRHTTGKRTAAAPRTQRKTS